MDLLKKILWHFLENIFIEVFEILIKFLTVVLRLSGH